VTYHGVEAVGGDIILAANEGRSYVDAFDMKTGKHLARLTDVSQPCCIERIPGLEGFPTRVLSNLGDGHAAASGGGKRRHDEIAWQGEGGQGTQAASLHPAGSAVTMIRRRP